jgi:hypothetical protein
MSCGKRPVRVDPNTRIDGYTTKLVTSPQDGNKLAYRPRIQCIQRLGVLKMKSAGSKSAFESDQFCNHLDSGLARRQRNCYGFDVLPKEVTTLQESKRPVIQHCLITDMVRLSERK